MYKNGTKHSSCNKLMRMQNIQLLHSSRCLENCLLNYPVRSPLRSPSSLLWSPATCTHTRVLRGPTPPTYASSVMFSTQKSANTSLNQSRISCSRTDNAAKERSFESRTMQKDCVARNIPFSERTCFPTRVSLQGDRRIE